MKVDNGASPGVEGALTAVILAAGQGTRLGGTPKVWRELSSAPLWWWSLLAFQGLAARAVLVTAGDRVEEAQTRLAALSDWVTVTAGGQERWESSQLALRHVRTPFVAVHDAARPLVSPALVRRVLEAARATGAAVPGMPPKDTVKLIARGQVATTLPRDHLVLVQTPQVFRTEWLRAAFQAENTVLRATTDDSSLVEALGRPVAVVPGDPDNRKITDQADWDWLEGRWRDRDAGGPGL